MKFTDQGNLSGLKPAADSRSVRRDRHFLFLPNQKIVVGLWGAKENVTEASQRVRDSGADEVVTTLADAVVRVARLAPTPKVPAITNAA